MSAPARPLERLAQLLADLERNGDPAPRELLRIVLDLHGEALDALLESVSSDAAMLARIAADARVRGILMLHGLHPESIETRVGRALEQPQGCEIERIAVLDGRVRVHIRAGPKSPPAEKLRRRIEDAVYEAAPDAAEVEIEGLPVPTAYVPLSALTHRS